VEEDEFLCFFAKRCAGMQSMNEQATKSLFAVGSAILNLDFHQQLLNF
jgi:hypothetical protein